MCYNDSTAVALRASISRGKYGELIAVLNGDHRTKYARAWNAVNKICKELDSSNSDEHGAWTTGAAFDRKGRGSAINLDIYGVDIVDGQYLGVVQVRQFERRYKNGWGNIRKNYFLVGRNENGGPFAHPVPAQVIRRTGDSPESPVTAARSWIFDCPKNKLPLIKRHGDVAAIPVRCPRGEQYWSQTHGIQLIDEHYLIANQACSQDGRLYVKDFHLYHGKRQHPDVNAAEREGWFRIQVGRRSDFWSFSKPTAD